MTENDFNNSENEKAMYSFISRNMSLYHFLWVLFTARCNQGAVIGNWIKMDMNNKFFDVEMKLTIKRKPTHKDKQVMIENGDWDLDKLAEDLKGV